jgi:hypothetical protein
MALNKFAYRSLRAMPSPSLSNQHSNSSCVTSFLKCIPQHSTHLPDDLEIEKALPKVSKLLFPQRSLPFAKDGGTKTGI